MASIKSLITDIEYLSKTRNSYDNELSFAGKGLKLNKREDAVELSKEIEKTPNLKVLRLEGNTIGPEGAEELARALEKQAKLERFIGNDIFTGRLKDEIPLALKSICGAIERSGARLVEINMSDNAFGPIGLDALMNFFQSECCFSLKELRLHNNGLGPEGAKKLAHSLEQGYRKSGGKLGLKVFVCGRNRLEYEGAKAVSNSLQLMGTLEEIQMPQNGIRPNGIEFLANACASNPNLRIINFNDNTFRRVGGEWVAKAINGLKNLEYVNFGDCLLRSKGALLIVRSLVNSNNLKELILSFNEISFNTGIEIAKLIAHKFHTLSLLDLNGNKFGEEGKLEIKSLLAPVGEALLSLSEDEGSDEEEGDADEDEGEDEEEENSEVVVDGEDYDEVEDYEEYDEEEGEYDDDGEDEEGDEDEENDDEDEEESKKYGSVDIVQQPNNLFRPFNNTYSQAGKTIHLNPAQLNLNKLNLNTQTSANLFTNMVNNKYMCTNAFPLFDKFITEPSLNNLKVIDQETLEKVSHLEKFDGKYLVTFLSHLSKVYDKKSPDSIFVYNCASSLINAYFKNQKNSTTFCDDFLTALGFLKSEEKSFHPIDLSENFFFLIENFFKENVIPVHVKEQILNYLKLRSLNETISSSQLKQERFKQYSQVLIKHLS